MHAVLEPVQGPPLLWSVPVHHLVSRVEIAHLLGVSQQRVHQLVAKPDFPAPVIELAIGKVWNREDVERWARATGRLPAEGNEA